LKTKEDKILSVQIQRKIYFRCKSRQKKTPFDANKLTGSKTNPLSVQDDKFKEGFQDKDD
jgi:hypothetical protein